MSADKEMKSGSAADIARHWQLEGGIGFLLRLLEARYDVLYQNLTRQSEITPRQFGVLDRAYINTARSRRRFSPNASVATAIR